LANRNPNVSEKDFLNFQSILKNDKYEYFSFGGKGQWGSV
jgi:hypothetical protein